MRATIATVMEDATPAMTGDRDDEFPSSMTGDKDDEFLSPPLCRMPELGLGRP